MNIWQLLKLSVVLLQGARKDALLTGGGRGGCVR